VSNIKLPAGFKAISGTGDSVTWKKGLVVTGVVLNVKTVKTKQLDDSGKQKEARLMLIETKDGEAAIWEKAGLTHLFDVVKKGQAVYIKHDGFAKAKPGQSPANMFTCAVKE
jgi:hypothetical protein